MDDTKRLLVSFLLDKVKKCDTIEVSNYYQKFRVHIKVSLDFLFFDKIKKYLTKTLY